MSVGLRKEDTVAVITGKHKGRQGRVLAVNNKKGTILIEKINIIKKHMKPNKTYSQGGIIEKEAPINRSNVILVCPKCGKPTKVGMTVVQDVVKNHEGTISIESKPGVGTAFRIEIPIFKEAGTWSSSRITSNNWRS